MNPLLYWKCNIENETHSLHIKCKKFSNGLEFQIQLLESWYVYTGGVEEEASEWVSHSLGLHNLIHFECHLTELDSPCAPTGTKISSDNNFQIIQFLVYGPGGKST